MKYLSLVLAGLWRRPARTVLTFLSIAVAFVLFGVLATVQSVVSRQFDLLRLDRLYVDARFGGAMPLAYLPHIAATPGVRATIPLANLNGTWREPRNAFSVVMTTPDYVLARPEYTITRAQLEALERSRNGIIVSKLLARTFGWKVGERIALTSKTAQRDGSQVWDLEILAIADNRDDPGTTAFALGSYRFFDEGRAADRGTVNRFIVRIADSDKALDIAHAIDRNFANAPQPTRTVTEKGGVGVNGLTVGDITFFTRAVIAAVLFMILFITGNTLMQSMRERIPEFAVLKTLGFSDGGVLGLVLAEALLLCVLAGAAGMGLVRLAALFFGGALPRNTGEILLVPWQTALTGLFFALLMAVIAGFGPALKVKRLNVVDALAGR